MKKALFLFLFLAIANNLFAQEGKQINSIIQTYASRNLNVDSLVDKLTSSPDLYNKLWKFFIDQAKNSNDKKWTFLKDLDVQFKTFQATDNSNAALGVSYDFTFSEAKYIEKANSNRISHSFNLDANGNIAFNKKFNPTDFLEFKANYSYSHFMGGVLESVDDTSVFTRLNQIEDRLVDMANPNSEEARVLWKNLEDRIKLTNQYYYLISPKLSIESNQDFSKTQFLPGIAVDLSAKGWNHQSTLAGFNIFDYPFALVRLITGTDKKFTRYGSTIPSVGIVADYVIPTNDSVREGILGNIDPYPRFKFETSFRTLVSRIEKQNIFFNANFRVYQEINASTVIKAANLSSFTYFVMALQTSSGLYVSYANGKLPFDAKSDEVYSIGFNYDFNSK
jgi:hypothetical protein